MQKAGRARIGLGRAHAQRIKGVSLLARHASREAHVANRYAVASLLAEPARSLGREGLQIVAKSSGADRAL
jgi:hypothetical protein